MLRGLENLDEIKRLIEKNYSLSISDAHLVVNDVFYLDSEGALKKGRLAAPLNQPTPDTVGAPVNHQMYWSGDTPYYIDGTPIPQLGTGGPIEMRIGNTTYVRHLSNKPPEGFSTYELLVEHYVALLSGPAQEKCHVTPQTGAVYDVPADSSPFKVLDTFSARAEILDINARIAEDKIAIIGLGGTGAYVLDFLVKAPVKSIDAYDFDVFKVHNGFRSPGEVPFDQFGKPKVDLYRRKYEPFRHQINFHQKRVGCQDAELFDGITFAFVCIDDGESRAEVCGLLNQLGITFIDVGMGVEKENDHLDGLIRTTLFTQESWQQAIQEVPLDARPNEGAYRVFVQISELNALNATMAVIRYKQFRGFYADEKGFYQSIISLGTSSWIGEA